MPSAVLHACAQGCHRGPHLLAAELLRYHLGVDALDDAVAQSPVHLPLQIQHPSRWSWALYFQATDWPRKWDSRQHCLVAAR